MPSRPAFQDSTIAADKIPHPLLVHAQDFAQVHLESRLRSGARGTDAVLAALSGHQLGAAMALAAASGDVRLATLLAQVPAVSLPPRGCRTLAHRPATNLCPLRAQICDGPFGMLQCAWRCFANVAPPSREAAFPRCAPQAGKRGGGTADATAQLRVWEEAGMNAHIDTGRLSVYRILGGQLDAVVPKLHLPWRLALGMHLWCVHCRVVFHVALCLTASCLPAVVCVSISTLPPPCVLTSTSRQSPRLQAWQGRQRHHPRVAGELPGVLKLWRRAVARAAAR